MMALAIDHRVQLEDAAKAAGVGPEKIAPFKVLAVKAAARVAGGREGYGMLIDEKHGRDAMFEFARHPFAWLGRPVELPGSRPLRFEFSQDIGSQLVEWPVEHCIKCLCFYHPDDPAALKAEQQQKLRTLFEAARKVGRELLIEIIAGKHGRLPTTRYRASLEELYALGIKPDWWKLEPQSLGRCLAQDRRGDRAQRSALPRRRAARPGGAGKRADRRRSRATAGAPIVKGFAVGRTIFMEPAERWFAGSITDEEAIADMAGRFERLTNAWLTARKRKAA